MTLYNYCIYFLTSQLRNGKPHLFDKPISDKKITFLGDYSNLVNFLKSFNFLKSLYFCDHITITKSDALLHIDYMYDKHNLIKL